MRGKKGEEDITKPETVKIIVSVLGIVILLGLFVAIYSSFTKTRLDQAIPTLDQISQVIRELRKNESKNYLVESPGAWNLVYFSKSDKKPVSCGGETCLCICDSSWLNSYDASTCKDKNGICKTINYNISFKIF